MKLEGIPVQLQEQGISKSKPKSAATEQVNLYLTLQFNEQRELLIGGQLKFGLKGGELRLKLENAKIPLEFRNLAGSLELFVHKERQHQESSESQSGIKASLATSNPEVKANLELKKTGKFQCLVCQITHQGLEENPTWFFEVGKGEPVLKGLLKDAKLATMNVTAKPCCVEATFEVSPQDVYMTEAQGLWSKNISKKRSAVIERALIRHFLERKLKPYLSRQKLRYEE